MNSKILFLIILLAFILRFFQLGENPSSLDWDEAALGYNAYSILKTASDEYGNFLPLSIRSFNDYKPPLYTYLTIPPIYFFGLNEYSTRLPSALFGTFAVILVYYLIKQLLASNKLALLTSLILAISPWHLQFSRIAFEANIALTLIIFGTLLFIKGLKNNSYLLFSAMSYGLSVYAYHSPRLIVPLLILGLILIFFHQIKSKYSKLVLFLILFFLFYLPIIKEFNSASSARFSSVSVINPDEKLVSSIKAIEFDDQKGDYLGKFFHNRRIVFAREILSGYLDHFNFEFLFLTGDPPGRHHASGMGMLYIFEFPFIIIGFLSLLRNLNKNPYKLILLQFILAPLASSFTSGTPHAVRAIYYLPTYQFFTALGLILSLHFIKIRKIYIRLISFIVCLFYSFNIFYYLHQYYIHTPVEYAKEWQYGYKQAVKLSQFYEKEVSKIIFTYSYDQPYIFFLYYGNINPFWYQKNWGAGEINRAERKFGKYIFRNIKWEDDKNLSNVLLVGTPSEIPENAAGKIAEVNFPDGTVAFRFVLR